MTDLSLSEFRALAEVAATRGFRSAAARLDLAPSTLSRQVALLEGRLGLRLFNRTTRSVTLTAEGAALLGRLAPAMAQVEQALAEARSEAAAPSGPLRINGSEEALAILMPPALDFLAAHPRVELDLVADGMLSDIVAGGFDAGLRLAEAVPRDMTAIPLGPDRRLVTVASPGYLAGVPALDSPADLTGHECIRARLPSGRFLPWEFRRDGRDLRVRVAGRLIVGAPEHALEPARRGMGIAYVAETAAEADLAAGRLVAVLQDWTPAFEGLRLYYPAHRAASVTLRAFAAHLRRARRG